MLVSFLLPTRNRLDAFRRTVDSIFSTASDPKCVEIIVRLDEDDETGTMYRDWLRTVPNFGIRVVSGSRYGYSGLHYYYNELMDEVRGRWCVPWGDDAIMRSPGWDDALIQIRDEVVVAFSETIDAGRSPVCFPFFTRKVAEVLGHVSLNYHIDTWLEEVARAAKIGVDVPIRIEHNRLRDALAKSYQGADHSSGDYYSSAMLRARRRDVELLLSAKCGADAR